MNSVYREIHEGLREELLQRLGRRRFQLWFRDTAVVDVNEEGLTLAVPNDAHGTWLQYTYADELREACEAVLGEGVRVRVEISPEQEQRRVVRETLPQDAEAWDALLARRRASSTLDTFVSGLSARFPVLILRQILEGGAARDAACFYLYGACGAGKTHLLTGLKADLERRVPGSALYLGARRFTQRYVTAVRAKQVDAMLAFELDVTCRRLVLIDEIDQLAARPATQAALVRLLARCEGSQTRFVFAGRKHPGEIDGFSQRLRSRILGGIVMSIQPPDDAVLGEILESRSSRIGCRAPEAVRAAILERTSSVRGAVGLVDRWAAASAELGRPLEIEWLEDLAPSVAATAKEEVIRRVKDVVAEHFGVARRLLEQPTKVRSARFPRRVALYLVYRACALPLTDLGRAFGLRSHSSVSRAIREMRELRLQDAGVEQLVDGLLARV